MKYQVWSYSWSNGYGPIPDRLLFGGQTFKTKRAADEAWYDTCPGCNDHHVVLKQQPLGGGKG